MWNMLHMMFIVLNLESEYFVLLVGFVVMWGDVILVYE